ncbi:hypothetical protein BJ973_009007 [Actinoplanes tereljensis]|uniref:Uncharacterized protein n=1 Tax=Paractinoplanes tereljensis TaxID=571912 RepID=A0A919NHT1_9ACTN|nr:hypothetical protein [Actinoplanes tereljensis]GIF18027.1 hypothetical protein Ate02nite_07570 [Actinoplanes tereljensis]
MFRSLQNAKLRRLLLLGAAVFTVVLLFIQYFITPGKSKGDAFRAVAQDNLANLVALVVTSGLGLAFYHFFVKDEQELDQIRALDPQTSRLKHAHAAETSGFWYAEGQVGRWVRDNVFLAFAKRAREGMQIHDVRLALLDPRAEDLCAIHAVRRRSHLTRREQRWDVARVQAEICATILASIAYCAMYDRMRIRVFLRPGSTPFRVDICTDFLFVTQDDALAPVITIMSDSKHYRSVLAYFQEYDRNEPEAIEINVQAAANLVRKFGGPKAFRPDRYEAIAQEAGLAFPALADPDFCKLVQKCCPTLRGELT